MSVQSNKGGKSRAECAQERQELILDVALELFAERGVEGTSMKSLAQRAGISAGLIYHYFDSKSDLLDKVIEHRGVTFPDLTDQHDRSVHEVIPYFALQFSESVKEHIDVVWIFFQEYRSSKTVEERIGKRRDKCLASLADYFEARQKAGEVRQVTPLVAARTLLGALFQVHLTESPSRELVEEMVEIFLTGIKS